MAVPRPPTPTPNAPARPRSGTVSQGSEPLIHRVSLKTPLAQVLGIGPQRALLLESLGVRNAGQLIAHLPMRHEQLEAEQPIARCVSGAIVSARGEVVSVGGGPTRSRKPRVTAVMTDGTGRLDLVWFNMAYMRERLHPGVQIRVQGKAMKKGPTLELVNPKTEVLRAGSGQPSEQRERLRPVYPSVQGVASWQIEQAVQRVIAGGVLDEIEEHLPESLRTARQMPPLREAYRSMHAPAHQEEASSARRRLAYDELLLLQVALATARNARISRFLSPALRWSEAIDRHIRARFPFPLTPAQDRVVREIAADLQRDVPTNRLVQGDVGSGKTVVALYAMLMAVAGRHQAALMAPTELLAEQHMASIQAMLRGSDVQVRLLTGGMEPAVRQRVLREVESGRADLVIGTHALLTESVRFHSLAVAVVDEQHKFGVHQRATLRSRGEEGNETRPLTPHVLVMTATPIPRTLAMSLLGDLDVSTIDELPPGRRAIATRVVTSEKEPEVLAYIRKRLDKSEQAYVVVPAIEPGSSLYEPAEGQVRLASVREVLTRLEKGALAGKKLGAVHGRMDAQARERVMDRFRTGEIDVLVATTVIEVGVDVPNATMMVVMNAERFGLAQLHQLRGRVGRGAKASVCVLIADPTTPDAIERLGALARSNDGFRIAEKDLEIRGFGDVAGIRQSGVPPFKVADLSRDLDLLSLARTDAAALVAGKYPLEAATAAALRRRMIKTHGRWLGLADTA